MYISIPTRDCRAAIGAAINAGEDRIKADIAQAKEQAYKHLRAGAEHNGMKIDDARDKEMRDMVDRDAEHMLDQHPGKQTLQVLQLLQRMLARNEEDFVVLDDADFSMLEEHLPKLENVDERARRALQPDAAYLGE